MPTNGISQQMAWWWYLVLVSIDLVQAQNPFDGGGFLPDPFLELTGGITTPPSQKSNKTDSSCVSNGTLAGSIIATLLLSALIAFLTWMVYLRQKLQDLQAYENRWRRQLRTSPQNHRAVTSISRQSKTNHSNEDTKNQQLPLNVTDYKFGTFPFRQSQIQGINGHPSPSHWLNRVPSSFRSATTDQDIQTMDIELLNPTFCGLNFSITGNMRAGIFVKEILDKETSVGQIKLNSSDQLRTGDRIIALTVCFESIVYEDALTILSYASPYPVILRVQRPTRATQVNIETEKRPTPTTKVKWRDNFEHYDNDTSYNRSVTQADSSKTLITELKSVYSTSHHHRPSTKKSHHPSKSPSTSKGNKFKTKRSNLGKKKPSTKTPNPIIFASTGLSSKPLHKISTPPSISNKTAKKSVTNTVISYLHHRGTDTDKHRTVKVDQSETTMMPYYDSPYDYYGAQSSLNQNQNNNNNNNNSSSTESLAPVTSVYTLQLSSTNPNSSTQRTILSRRCKRRLSSPAVILSKTIEKNISPENIDTFV